jgi:hypothetical protein
MPYAEQVLQLTWALACIRVVLQGRDRTERHQAQCAFFTAKSILLLRTDISHTLTSNKVGACCDSATWANHSLEKQFCNPCLLNQLMQGNLLQ